MRRIRLRFLGNASGHIKQSGACPPAYAGRKQTCETVISGLIFLLEYTNLYIKTHICPLRVVNIVKKLLKLKKRVEKLVIT